MICFYRKQKKDLMVRSRAFFTRGVSNHADEQFIGMVRDASAARSLLTMRERWMG